MDQKAVMEKLGVLPASNWPVFDPPCKYPGMPNRALANVRERTLKEYSQTNNSAIKNDSCYIMKKILGELVEECRRLEREKDKQLLEGAKTEK